MSVIINIAGWGPAAVEALLAPLRVVDPSSKHSPEVSVAMYRRVPGKYVFLPLAYFREHCGHLIAYAGGENWDMQRYIPAPPFSFTQELRPRQVPVAEEALQMLTSAGGVTLHLQTGFGKTALSLYIASRLSSRGHTVVLAAKSLIPQWRDSMSKFTDAQIAVVEARKTAPQAQIFISTPGKLKHLPYHLRSPNLLVVDEAHTYRTADRITALLLLQPRYIILNSATLLDCPAVHKRMNFFVPRSNLINPPLDRRLTVDVLKTGFNLNMPTGSDGCVDWNKLCTLLATQPERNALIVEEVIRRATQHKILVLMWRNAGHLEILREMFEKRGVTPASYSGSDKSYRDNNIVLATIGKAGTGFDAQMVAICGEQETSRPIDTIVLAASMRSPSLLKQIAGRAFRSPEPRLVYLRDDHFLAHVHWRAAKKVFQDQGATIRYN